MDRKTRLEMTIGGNQKSKKKFALVYLEMAVEFHCLKKKKKKRKGKW